jgi:3-hydroxyacyl-CoA dehydrogenase
LHCAILQFVISLQVLKKTPIVVFNCVGFTANRIFFPYGAAAGWLCAFQHLSPYAIDRGLREFGIPIGCFALADLVGLDVGLHVDAVKLEAYGSRLTIAGAKSMQESLVKQGRLGRSTGRGWYIYEKGSRKPKEDEEIVARFADQRKTITVEEGVRMMLYLVANEGC